MKTSSCKAKAYVCSSCNRTFENYQSHNSHKRWCGNIKGSIDGYGYRKIFVIEEHKQRKEHRIIMENYLGRKLSQKEHIHHINGIIIDNRIENLQLMDIREHGSLEGKKGKGIKKTFENRVPWNYKKVEVICPICKKLKLRSPSHANRKYCSRICWRKSKCQ